MRIPSARIPSALLVCGALASGAAAQTVRTPVLVDLASTGRAISPAVAADGALSAILYCGKSMAWGVWVTTSDGTGTTWSAPVRVDADRTAARKRSAEDGVQVVGGSVYAVWEDDRNGAVPPATDLYFNASYDGGQTWQGEVRIDKGYPAGANPVRDWRFLAADDGQGNHHLYLVFAVEGDVDAREELYVVASDDGGATFEPPLAVSSVGAGIADVDELAAALGGADELYVAWQDDRGGSDQVFFRASTDGAATFTGTDQQLSTGNADAELAMDVAVRGATVAVAWQEEPVGSPREDLWVNVSTAGGTRAWSGATRVGKYKPIPEDVDDAVLTVTDQAVLVAWNDGRTGRNEVRVASSTDGGTTWTETLLSTDGGNFPRFAPGGASTVVVTWTTDVFPNRADAAHSLDGGLTWQPTLALSSFPSADVDFAAVAYNPTTDDAVAVFLADPTGVNRVYAGGIDF